MWEDLYNNDKMEEKDLNFLKFKLDKKTSAKDFEKFLQENLKIDSLKDYFIFKKLEYAHSNYKISEIKIYEKEKTDNNNHNKNNEFIIDKENNNNKNDNINNNYNYNGTENYLFENSKIYIEKKTEEWIKEENEEKINISRINDNDNNDKNEKNLQNFSNFKYFFDQRLSNFIINFNVPLKQEKKIRITVGSYKFNQMIEIKPNKTLKDLKLNLSEYLKISEDEFIMRKLSHNGIELKNLGDNLDKICSGNLKVYLEFGIPQKENQLKLNVFLCELDMSFFLLFPYKITEIGFFDIDISNNNNDLKIKDLKLLLLKEIKNKKGIDFEFYNNDNNLEENDYFIIREYLNERPTKVKLIILILQ
jgi:hypothetical protein